MTLWRKIVVNILCIMFAIPVVFVASVYAGAWYHRWKANQFIAVVKTVTPGVTTQAQYLAAIQPFESTSGWILIGDKTPQGAIVFTNRPNWMENPWLQRVSFFGESLLWRVIPPAMDFVVIPDFENGVLSKLSIEEMTAVSGHPPGVFVHWDALRFESLDSRVNDDFRGYELSQMGPNGAPWEFFVTMDERATPHERNRALDIQVNCFTKIAGCMAAHEFLQPAPARQEQAQAGTR